MSAKLRPGVPDDAEVCGQICYEAFGSISAAHGFPSDFPSADVAIGLVGMLLGHPGFFSLVAEVDGQVVGSNFLDERAPIVGVGPNTVPPAAQDDGDRRALMDGVLARAVDIGAPGVRLVQSGYHNRSLALYAKLGFAARRVACLHAGPSRVRLGPRLCRPVGNAGGHRRVRCPVLTGPRPSPPRRSRRRRRPERRPRGRARRQDQRLQHRTGVLRPHRGRDQRGFKALIGSASAIVGPGILVPLSNTELVGWCLANGLRVVQLMTLMTIGLYNEPAGSYLPSILY